MSTMLQKSRKCLFNFTLKNIWSQKKSRYRSRKHLVSKKVSVSVSKTFGLKKKSRYRSRKHLVSKKVSVSVSKIFCLKKSLGFSLENIWSQKKSRYRSRKYLVSKKVSVLVLNAISGLATQ